MAPATMLDTVAVRSVPADGGDTGWDQVVDEIRESCARRAGVEQLFRTADVVGVLAGAAPVLWAHGAGDAAGMMAALARSPEVDDVYVGPAATGARAALLAAGWRSAGMQTQLVVQRAGWSGGAADDVRELGVADLPEFRRTLARATGADDRLLTASYGDDFFERAHPAWLFGKFDGAWLVGTVGMRLQQRSAMVFALGVDDSDRSRGVARDLVRAAVSQAFAAGATFVHALAEPAGLRVGLAAGASVVGSWEQFERP